MCLETMLVRVVWDVCGDVWKNDFFMILAIGESSEIGLHEVPRPGSLFGLGIWMIFLVSRFEG